jgi:ABC-2 type transport system ATP-binding protein
MHVKSGNRSVLMEVLGMAGPADLATDVVLEFRDVRKQFTAGGRRIQALRDISFAVRRGRVTGLIGPDGAGKTTLMRMAVGLLVPDGGKVVALGFDATRESLEVQARVGYMPQRFGLYEDLSVQENLDLYAGLKGVPPEARGPRYDELMRMTGLGRFTARLAGRLSGGMKQKLGLACTPRAASPAFAPRRAHSGSRSGLAARALADRGPPGPG